MSHNNHIFLQAFLNIQVEKYRDFNDQGDLNKVICAMHMRKVAVGDFKTIQLCMNVVDRQLMTAHMGKKMQHPHILFVGIFSTNMPMSSLSHTPFFSAPVR